MKRQTLHRLTLRRETLQTLDPAAFRTSLAGGDYVFIGSTVTAPSQHQSGACTTDTSRCATEVCN